MYPSRTSRELAIGAEKYFGALKYTVSPLLTTLTARHGASLLQLFHFVLGDI